MKDKLVNLGWECATWLARGLGAGFGWAVAGWVWKKIAGA